MILLFVALFSTLPFLIAYRNISPYKFTLKEYAVMEICIVVTYYLFSLIDQRLSSIAIYFLPIIFIYRKFHKLITSILLDIFICVVIIITDSCIALITTNIFNIDPNISNTIYLFLCLLILLSVHFVSKFIGILTKKYKSTILVNYKSKYAVLIYLSLVTTFGIFYINMNWNISRNPMYLAKTNSLFFLAYAVILLFICLILMLIIKKDESFKSKQIQFENLQEYTNNLEDLYMDMRKFRHDYINILSSMSCFIEDNDMNSLKSYFNDTIYPLNKKIEKNNHKLGLLKNLKMSEVKGLVSSKLIRAQELGLNVNIDIVEPISNINMNTLDLIRSLGILLDNAIEAAISSDNKSISLGIIKKPSSTIILVINSYSGELPPISQLFKENFSTKGKNRGLGLSNLREMVNNNSNVLLDTSFENSEFIQSLTIGN